MKRAIVKRRESVALHTLRTTSAIFWTFGVLLIARSCITAATTASGPVD